MGGTLSPLRPKKAPSRRWRVPPGTGADLGRRRAHRSDPILRLPVLSYAGVSCAGTALQDVVILAGQDRGGQTVFACDLLARLQRQQRERGAGVADVVVAVGVKRLREPPARRALVRLQPGDPLPDRPVAGRQPRLAQDVDDEPGAVAVARRFRVARPPVEPLPLPQRLEAPPAVGLLEIVAL